MARPDETVPRLSDEELLARLRAGDRDRFGELVRRYERELFGYLRRYTGNEDLAADVFQNTFTQVFLKIGQYEIGRAARPWLYTIATHQAIDALRKRNRRADMRGDTVVAGDANAPGPARPLIELLEAREPGPDDHAEAAELRQAVRTAVDGLPDLLREVVALAYFQGLKYQEIADVLDIPLGTVKSRLHAALAKLAETWDDSGTGQRPEET